MHKKIISVICILFLLLTGFFPARQAEAAEDKAGVGYVALGDSLALGVGSSKSYVQRFYEQIKDRRGVKELTLIAEEQATSRDLLRFVTDPDNREAIKKARVITIWFGAHDFMQAVRRNPHNYRQAGNELKENLITAVQLIRSINTGKDTTIYLLNFYNPAPGEKVPGVRATDPAEKKYEAFDLLIPYLNGFIADAVKQVNSDPYMPPVVIVDVFKAMQELGASKYLGKGKDPVYPDFNNAHLSDAGHKAVAEALLKAPVSIRPGRPLAPSRVEEFSLPTNGAAVSADQGRLAVDFANASLPANALLYVKTYEGPPFIVRGELLSPVYDLVLSFKPPQAFKISLKLDQNKVKDWKNVYVFEFKGNGQKLKVRQQSADTTRGTITAVVKRGGLYGVVAVKNSFPDTAKHWARGEIEKIAGLAVIDGDEQGYFRPERPVTRAEAVKMLVEATGVEVEDNIAATFSDVQSSAWYAPYVAAAAKAGLMQGYQGKFRPGDKLTRQELAVILERAYGSKIKGGNGGKLESYSDRQQVATWAQGAVNKLVEAGILKGRKKDKLAPAGVTTRAELAALLARLMS